MNVYEYDIALSNYFFYRIILLSISYNILLSKEKCVIEYEENVENFYLETHEIFS